MKNPYKHKSFTSCQLYEMSDRIKIWMGKVDSPENEFEKNKKEMLFSLPLIIFKKKKKFMPKLAFLQTPLF